jgi:hypothetical protein
MWQWWQRGWRLFLLHALETNVRLLILHVLDNNMGEATGTGRTRIVAFFRRATRRCEMRRGLQRWTDGMVHIPNSWTVTALVRTLQIGGDIRVFANFGTL